MSEALIGLAVGIPLGVAALGLGWLGIRTMLAAADKPGISPALIPLALLAGLGMILYASNPELTELAGISSVAVGAMATYLAQIRADRSHPLVEGQTGEHATGGEQP